MYIKQQLRIYIISWDPHSAGCSPLLPRPCTAEQDHRSGPPVWKGVTCFFLNQIHLLSSPTLTAHCRVNMTQKNNYKTVNTGRKLRQFKTHLGRNRAWLRSNSQHPRFPDRHVCPTQPHTFPKTNLNKFNVSSQKNIIETICSSSPIVYHPKKTLPQTAGRVHSCTWWNNFFLLICTKVAYLCVNRVLFGNKFRLASHS